MPDQVIGAAMARALHADACRDHALVAWVVMWDAPGYPDRFIARLTTKRLSPYLLLAETLERFQADWKQSARSSSLFSQQLYQPNCSSQADVALAGVQEQLPPRLVRSERQPADPPEVVEIWFA